jgi:transcriptional regulator with XRE-family HTH domain
MPRKRNDELELQLGPWIDRLGLDRKKVAEDAGIGESYLSQLINHPEKVPSIPVLFSLTRAMGFDNPRDLYVRPPSMALSGAELALIARNRKPPSPK